jgi:YVTN family beta-propeller protein
VPRGELAEALWGEEPPSTWEKALSVLVSKLRVLLGENGIDGASALTGAFGCYRLELPEGSWVDILAAAVAAHEAQEALTAGETEKARTAAALAESLVRQPFLPGEDGTWVEEKRRELAEVRARALTVLADASLRSADGRDAAQWAEQAIALEPFRESGYRRLMQAHVVAGDRAEALRTYDRCRRLLAEELGAYPSPETESIYRGLLEAPPTRTARSQAPPAETGDPEGAALPTRVGIGGRSRRLHGRGGLLALAAGGVLAVAGLVMLVLAVRPFGLGGGSGGASASTNGSTVAAIDSSDARAVGAARLDGSPSAIAYGEGSVWVTMSNQDSVSRIGPKTNTVQQTIGAGNGPTGIAVGGGFVWIASSLDGTVLRIDPRAHGGQVVDKIAVGDGPTGVAYGLGGVWVANSVDRTVERVDPLTDKPGQPISVDAGADAIAVGDGAVWVRASPQGSSPASIRRPGA